MTARARAIADEIAEREKSDRARDKAFYRLQGKRKGALHRIGAGDVETHVDILDEMLDGVAGHGV